jgi:superoxide dismutase, Fe-Mn family
MSSNDKELIGNYEVTKSGVVTRREVLLMGAMAAASGSLIAGAQNQAQAADAPAAAPSGAYKARDFKALAGTMSGLSASQINQHVKLYEGYVAKSNAIHDSLKTVELTSANATYSAVRELLIEQSFAQNGVVYHEYYFNNLGGKGGEPTGKMKSAIDERWGSTGKFMDFLKAAGKSARGWVIVGYNTRAGYVDAYALDTHNIASPANIVPLVVLDVYEHAYMIDYGIDRPKYLEAFINNLSWDVVEKRLNLATKHPTGADTTL